MCLICPSILIIFFLLFVNFSVYGEENLLTIKQQLDRLQREVNDLSKSIFRNNFQDNNNIESQNSMNISAFDMRVHDIERDIKTLNSNFEDLIFQIDELKILLDELTIKLDTTIINKDENIELSNISTSEINEEINSENTLGTLKISSENLSNSIDIEQKNNLENIDQNLNPEQEFQLAFDLLRSQKFDQAKNSLINFITNNEDNNLSGSAHYWLGEIYLLEKDFREAALIFAEGYQKYPLSLKAPDNLYKLSEALSKINKPKEACNTLKKFQKEHTNHKLINKSNNKIQELGCE